MGLRQAFEDLKDAACDLTSLDVQSFTGTLKAEVHGGEGGNIIDWEKLVADAGPDGGIKLVLASHFKFDGDATLYTAEGQIPADIRAAHADAIQAGQQIRKDLFEFFSDTVKGLL
jgi:hypothetical protein